MEGKRHILVVIGGISSNSLNKRFYNAFKELAPEGLELETFDIGKLPFFSQDLENDPPDSVVQWKDKIRHCDGAIFITPEYNRSIPGVLKNAIDWGSRPYGQNLWDSKPAGVLGASPGAIGTFGAQHHLRQVFVFLNIRAMTHPEFYFNSTRGMTEDGGLTDKSKQLASTWWECYEEWLDFFTEQRPGEYEATGQEESPYAQ